MSRARLVAWLLWVCAAPVAACGASAPRPDAHAQRSCPAPPPPCDCDAGAGAEDRDALERLAHAEEERAALLEELARRTQAQSQATDAGTAPASALLSASQERAYAQVRAAIASLDTQRADCDAVLDLVVHLRAAAAPVPPAQPLLCRDTALRGRLDGAVLAGTPAAGPLSSVRERLADLCGRFEQRGRPDERAQLVIQTYGEQVDRVERYTTEVAACATATGRAGFACTNTYGTIDATTVAEAQRAHQMVVTLRHELVAARAFSAPFPCTTPTLAQIAAVDSWQGDMTRAQMPSLVQGAHHVCESLGWDDAAVVESGRAFGRALDAAESNARVRKRALDQSAESLRAQLPQ